jgi:hypothetical protein
MNLLQAQVDPWRDCWQVLLRILRSKTTKLWSEAMQLNLANKCAWWAWFVLYLQSQHFCRDIGINSHPSVMVPSACIYTFLILQVFEISHDSEWFIWLWWYHLLSMWLRVTPLASTSSGVVRVHGKLEGQPLSFSTTLIYRQHQQRYNTFATVFCIIRAPPDRSPSISLDLRQCHRKFNFYRLRADHEYIHTPTLAHPLHESSKYSF